MENIGFVKSMHIWLRIIVRRLRDDVPGDFLSWPNQKDDRARWLLSSDLELELLLLYLEEDLVGVDSLGKASSLK